jgi:hypothetical protein
VVPRSTERTHAAARAWREGLCVLRTRPHALCVPRPFAFLFERLSPFIFSTPLAGAFSDFRRFHAAARATREGLCVTRTRPHAFCVPRPFAFLFERPRVA